MYQSKRIWRKGQNVVERRSCVAKHRLGSPTVWFTHNAIRETAASVAKFGTVTLTAAPSWRKLASTAKLLCLSNLKVETPKKKKKSWKWDLSHHCRERLMRFDRWGSHNNNPQPRPFDEWKIHFPQLSCSDANTLTHMHTYIPVSSIWHSKQPFLMGISDAWLALPGTFYPPSFPVLPNSK